MEARGTGTRLARLTPVPRGETGAEISRDLLGEELERSFTGERLRQHRVTQIGVFELWEA